ncbi:hypothetical protein FB451DRAFT_1432791 [Mycena latifolia]|nr:hypothetical protein FB451DRAFT_1432791 [Mycena latifolia]
MSLDLQIDALLAAVVSNTPHSSLSSILTHMGIHAVRVTWIDLSGTVRFYVLTASHFIRILASQQSSAGISVPQGTLGLIFDATSPGFGPMGEYLYAFDLRTIRHCGYAPGQLSIMGWFQNKPSPRTDSGITQNVAVDVCSRNTLKKVLCTARSTGIEFLVGFEIEFILLRTTEPVVPVNHHGWSSALATLLGSTESVVLEEIVRILQADGIEVQMYHSECAPGQFEIVTGPLPPLESVDALIATRQTIYNVASKHGLTATLAPQVFDDHAGTGAHVHISVQSVSSAVDPAEMTPHEQSFLSAILSHLPALAFLALPTPDSYKRVGDGLFSGGTWICWGQDNREAPLRLCNAYVPQARNIEFKLMDGTANPYLVLAGVLGAGYHGIRTGAILDMKGCGGLDVGERALESAAELDDFERKRLGITTRIPHTLDAARAHFAQDAVVTAIFGDDLAKNYMAVNTFLASSLHAKGGLSVMLENY